MSIRINEKQPTPKVTHSQAELEKEEEVLGAEQQESPPVPVVNEKEPIPLETSVVEVKQAPLEACEAKNLISILDRIYPISGKNGAPEKQIYLLKFLRDLQKRLESEKCFVSIKLIGSAVGHILNPEQTNYNDLDFLIQIEMPLESKFLTNISYSDSYIKGQVQSYCNYTKNIIASCLAAQFEESQIYLNGRIANECAKSDLDRMESGYFNQGKQVVINLPINRENLTRPSANRCSIIKLDALEFKTVIDICVTNETKREVIPGLKNPSAFDRDDLSINLTPLLKAETSQEKISLEVCSKDVSINKAKEELKSKKLCTSRPSGDKCLKGNDNITFKGCHYPDDETNREIFTQCLQDSERLIPLDKLRHRFEEYLRTEPFAVLCALCNFCINGVNLGVDFVTPQSFHELFIELFPTLKDKPSDLLFCWCELAIFLATNHDPDAPVLSIPKQSYYLVKPKRPLDLLMKFVQLLQKYPEISFKKLPFCIIKIDRMEQLFLEMKSRLDGKDLAAFAQVVFNSIQTLSSSHHDMAISLWSYADREQIFSAVEELETVACLERGESFSHLTTKQLTSLLDNLLFHLSYVTKKLSTEELAQAESFNALLLSLVKELCSRDLSLKELKYIQKLCEEIAPLPADIKEKITGYSLHAFARAASKGLEGQEREVTLEMIQEMVKICPVNEHLSNPFNGLLLSLVNELCGKNLSLEELKYIQKLFVEIAPVAEDIKVKITECCLDAFVKLASQGAAEEEREIILEMLKEMVKINPNNACLSKLFSDLICTHPQLERAEALLVEAMDSKILTQETPLALIHAYFSIFKRLIGAKSEKTPQFVEFALQSHAIMQVLLNPQTGNLSEEILLLIHLCGPLVSDSNAAQLIYLCKRYFTHLSTFTPEEKKQLEMLKILLKVLPKLTTVSMCQELIKETQSFFGKDGLKLHKLFEDTNTLSLPISQIYLICIQEILSSAPKSALKLWNHAERELVFANSAVDQLEAFACIQGVKSLDLLNKNQLIALFNKMVERLGGLHQGLNQESAQKLVSFHALLQCIASKLIQTSGSLDDLRAMQKLLDGIFSFECVSISLKEEIADKCCDIFMKLPAKKLKKKEQDCVIPAILKWLLELGSKNTAQKIASYLIDHKEGITLSKSFLKIPSFTSALVQVIQNYPLEKNLEWFTLLHKGKILHSNDPDSLKCCSRLLTQWNQKPSEKQLQEILPALQLVKSVLQTKSEQGISSELKDQALNCYTDFIQSCIASNHLQLHEQAENALKKEIHLIPASKKLSFFTDLICAHKKPVQAEALLTEAIKQKILSENTPQELIQAYLAVLKGLSSGDSKKVVQFIERALKDTALMHSMLASESKSANGMILLFISQWVPSPATSNHLFSLFKWLCANRERKKDSDFDVMVTKYTDRMFDQLLKDRKLTYKELIPLLEVFLEKENLIFFKKNPIPQMPEKLTVIVDQVTPYLLEFIQENYNNPSQRDECVKNLEIMLSYKKLGVIEDCLHNVKLETYKAMVLLDDLQGAANFLQKETQPALRIIYLKEVVNQCCNYYNKIQLLHSSKGAGILKMVEGFIEPVLYKFIPDFDVTFSCICKVIESSAGASEDNYAYVERLFKKLEGFLKSDSNKLTNLKESYKKLLLTLSLHPHFASFDGYLEFMEPMIIYVTQNRIVIDVEFIETIQKNIAQVQSQERKNEGF